MSDALNALLDSNLDDLQDLPAFEPFPAGVHQVIVTFESKEINKHPAVEVTLKLVETVELANPTEDKPQAAGSTTNVAYMLDNEFGQGSLKKLMKPFQEHFGTHTIREAMEAANGAEVQLVTKVRTNKDKTASYTDIVKVVSI